MGAWDREGRSPPSCCWWPAGAWWPAAVAGTVMEDRSRTRPAPGRTWPGRRSPAALRRRRCGPARRWSCGAAGPARPTRASSTTSTPWATAAPTTPPPTRGARSPPGPSRPAPAPPSAGPGRSCCCWGGGVGTTLIYGDGAAYDPAADAWRPLAASPLSPPNTEGVWTGQEFIVWGGRNIVDTKYFAEGAAYDPATDRWRMLPPVDLAARDRIVIEWTGKEVVVWGGGTSEVAFGDGAAYDPVDRPLATGGQVAAGRPLRRGALDRQGTTDLGRRGLGPGVRRRRRLRPRRRRVATAPGRPHPRHGSARHGPGRALSCSSGAGRPARTTPTWATAPPTRRARASGARSPAGTDGCSTSPSGPAGR